MSDQLATQTNHTIITNPYAYLHLSPNQDGTITRTLNPLIPDVPPSSDATNPTQVLSKDISINPSTNTWARIYLSSKQALDHSSKLPLIIFFHGGGFVGLSAASSLFHDLCSRIALELPGIVVSVRYRLAPQHRLPPAYDNAVEAFNRIASNCEVDWLKDHADYSKCFLVGSSAGGAIAYHAGLRTADQEITNNNLEPLIKIQGPILHQPFYGGATGRTRRSILEKDWIWPLIVTDLMWELSLPVGADRDHEYCNPTAGDGPKRLETIKEMERRVLVTGWDGDPLIDRQVGPVKVLEGKRVQAEGRCGQRGFHGVDVMEASKEMDSLAMLKRFVLPSI